MITAASYPTMASVDCRAMSMAAKIIPMILRTRMATRRTPGRWRRALSCGDIFDFDESSDCERRCRLVLCEALVLKRSTYETLLAQPTTSGRNALAVVRAQRLTVRGRRRLCRLLDEPGCLTLSQITEVDSAVDTEKRGGFAGVQRSRWMPVRLSRWGSLVLREPRRASILRGAQHVSC